MRDIVKGMTPSQVVDILGPPLDRMTGAEFIGDSAVAGSREMLDRVLDSESWLYEDVPTRGAAMMITFQRGVVDRIHQRPADVSATARAPDSDIEKERGLLRGAGALGDDDSIDIANQFHFDTFVQRAEVTERRSAQRESRYPAPGMEVYPRRRWWWSKNR